MLLLCVGQLTSNQELASSTVEPRPDHPLLRDIFLKQARAVSDNPRNEILVLVVGHGARSDTNDMHQEMELASTAEYVERRMKFVFGGPVGI